MASFKNAISRLSRYCELDTAPVAGGESFRSESMEALPISIDAYRLGFIGAGKMAESIAKGIVQSGLLPASRISTSVHSNPSRRHAFESFGVQVLPKNDNVRLWFILQLESSLCFAVSVRYITRIVLWFSFFIFLFWFACVQVVEESDVVIFSVKPQVGTALVRLIYFCPAFLICLFVHFSWYSRYLIEKCLKN